MRPELTLIPFIADLEEEGWTIEFDDRSNLSGALVKSGPMTLGRAVSILKLFKCENMNAALVPPEDDAEGDDAERDAAAQVTSPQ